MGNRRWCAAALILGISMAAAGCSSTRQGTERTSEAATEAREVLKKVTYTAADGSVSIILPDSEWKNVKDADGRQVFTSVNGELSITYADSKEELKDFFLGTTEKRLQKRLANLGIGSETYELQEFSYDDSEGVRECASVLKFAEPKDGAVYLVSQVSALDERGYQVTGMVKSSDPAILEEVKASVKSILVLKDPLAAEVLEGQDGTEGLTGAAESETPGVPYCDFYDTEGNYIRTTQDENGNWVDDNGKIYYFEQDGVRDEDGNFYPY